MIFLSVLILGCIYLFAPDLATILGLLAITGKVIYEAVKDPPDELSEIDIGLNEVKKIIPRKGATLEWKGKNTPIKVGGYTIPNPLVYISKDSPSCEDASCINLKLKIGKPAFSTHDPMGYYPSYLEMTPVQRANYLEWLSKQRKSALEDIGYAFVFFYGLERRFMVESMDASEVISEVINLRNRYGFSNSFLGYTGRFLAYAMAKVGLGKINENTFKTILDKTSFLNFEEGLLVTLAWLSIHQKPISASLAMMLVRNDPRTPRSVIPDRVPEEFRVLFNKKYNERFPNNEVLRIPKAQIKIEYKTASPSLLFSSSSLSPIKIPNVLAFKKPFSIWFEIWDQCTEELRPFSRKIKNVEEVNSREAYEILPITLKEEMVHPDSKHWERVYCEKTNQSGFAVISISEVASIQGFDKRDKLTKKQSLSLAHTSQEIGFGLEPDPRIYNKTFAWDDQIALFRRQEKHEVEVDSKYRSAAFILELGVAVAAVDGNIDQKELGFIKHFLEGQFLLSEEEIFRLEGLKQTLVSRPPSIQGLGKKIRDQLPQNQTEKICQFLVGVAAADGYIDGNEIKLLKKVYKAFGLDSQKLTDFVEEARQESSEPVVVNKANAQIKKSEQIPSRSLQDSPAGFTLDVKRLKEILINTKDVSDLLAEVLIEEEEETSVGTVTHVMNTIPDQSEPGFAGLKVQFHGAL
jgi:uncharacterized tellurite resistance protein B-like protein